jgi:riboflavin kinase/FMN adenylyltransferase
MRTYQGLGEVTDAPVEGRAIAIGVFDGVHRGHQRIVASAVQEAASGGGRSTVVTFSPHPDSVLHPRRAPRALTSVARRAELLEALGADELVVVKFDRQFAGLVPEAFCRLVLSDHLGARVVFVGENFRFGHQGLGTTKHLSEYGGTHGFEVRAVPLVDEAGEPISSTRIRELLRAGKVAEAARLLGRPHRVDGIVCPGRGRGRALDAPTANLPVMREMALPRSGIYVTRSTVDGQEVHASVTSLGVNPTFESDRRLRMETMLLDYSGDLYGRLLAVDFLDRIRPQRTFPDAESLARQIRLDVEMALRMHAERSILQEDGHA